MVSSLTPVSKSSAEVAQVRAQGICFPQKVFTNGLVAFDYGACCSGFRKAQIDFELKETLNKRVRKTWRKRPLCTETLTQQAATYIS